MRHLVVWTHPDRLLAQPGAPRHLGARLQPRVVGEVEQSLQLLGLTVREHGPHPAFRPLLGLRRHPGLVVAIVTRQWLHIW